MANATCACCSQVFIRSMPILHKNVFYPVLVGVAEKDSTEVNLEKYVCSLCNSGGGVLVVGCERRNGEFYASGIRFNTISELETKQSEIKKLMQFIQPEFDFRVDRVLVHANYASCENPLEEKNRFCIRVAIIQR